MLSCWWFEIMGEIDLCMKTRAMCIELTIDREDRDWDVITLVEMTITYRLFGPCVPLFGHWDCFVPTCRGSAPWLRPVQVLGRDEVGDWRLVILRFSCWFWLNLFSITCFLFGISVSFGSGSLSFTLNAFKAPVLSLCVLNLYQTLLQMESCVLVECGCWWR